MRKCIAVITDDPGWHGNELSAAFARHGYSSRYLSLTDCYFNLAGCLPDVVLPGFERKLPAGVFVRGVPGGTLEQVIMRLNVLHALREYGVVVYNDARAIERTVDKAMTSLLLRKAGVATPETWVCESAARAARIQQAEAGCGRTLVLKPLFGSQGIGICRVLPGGRLPDIDQYGGVFYLQAFLDTYSEQGGWRDWRVFVIDGHARAAMLRRSSKHWLTNRAQGAECERVVLAADLASTAEAAARAVTVDYAGVDLMQDTAGNWLVTEVNGIPSWFGLQKVHEVSIAGMLAEHFLGKLEREPITEACTC